MQTRLGKWSYGFENQRQSWADHRSYDGAIIAGSIPTTGYMINDKGWHDQSDIKQRPQTLPLEVFKLKRGVQSLWLILGPYARTKNIVKLKIEIAWTSPYTSSRLTHRWEEEIRILSVYYLMVWATRLLLYRLFAIGNLVRIYGRAVYVDQII